MGHKEKRCIVHYPYPYVLGLNRPSQKMKRGVSGGKKSLSETAWALAKREAAGKITLEGPSCESKKV